jgi:TPR repeat protein
MYENGWGVEKNVAEAIMWYRKAAAFGYQDAKASIDRLTQSGTSNTP